MKKNLLVDALLGLLLLVLLFGALELGLGALGLGDATGASNWSRGFDSGASYLLPNPEVEGGFVTQFQRRGGREHKIAPRTGKPRVILFGGSNTAGFPYGHLRVRLNKLSDRPRYWETINLGRQGYGSARVRIIFEQALEYLDPDIVVLYTGHNEFVERGFEMDLEKTQTVSSNSGPARMARETRLYRTLASHYTSKSAEIKPTTQSTPEAWKWEYEKFADISYDETLAQMRAYQDNVRAMCEAARERGVEVVLCTIVHNRLSVPFSSTFPDDLSDAEVAGFEASYAEAHALLPEFFGPLLPKVESERVHGFDYGNGDNRDMIEEVVLEGHRALSGRLEGRPSMLQKEERWDPKVRKLDAALQRFHARDLSPEERADLERAEALYTAALSFCEDHPRALFELACVEYLLGRDEDTIHARFEHAASADRAPRKGSDMQNQLVREVAEEIDGVVFCDIDAEFQDCTPLGLVSWESMIDHCHLTLGARHIIMEILAEVIMANWPPGTFEERRGE